MPWKSNLPEVAIDQIVAHSHQYRFFALFVLCGEWSTPDQSYAQTLITARPLLDDIEDFGFRVLNICDVDSDQFSSFNVGYKLKSHPAMCCFAKGEMKTVIYGLQSQSDLMSRIEEFIVKSKNTMQGRED